MVVLLRLRDVAGEARVEEVGQVCDLASILHIFAIDVVDLDDPCAERPCSTRRRD